MTTAEHKLNDIRTALQSMAIGACGSKWDRLAWRVSETGWIVGETGVRKDGFVHDIDSAVEWFAWKRGIVTQAT